MWKPQFAPPAMRSGYGLGFDVSFFDGQRRVGHSGAIYGLATDVQALPDSKLGVAIVMLGVALGMIRRPAAGPCPAAAARRATGRNRSR